jgi:hypothetical protein
MGKARKMRLVRMKKSAFNPNLVDDVYNRNGTLCWTKVIFPVFPGFGSIFTQRIHVIVKPGIS